MNTTKRTAYYAAYRITHKAEILAKRADKAAKQAAYRFVHKVDIAARGAAYRSAYNVAHKADIAARGAAYRTAHKADIAAKRAVHYAAHKAEMAAYRAAHKTERAASNAAYKTAHPEIIAVHRSRRRAAKAAAPVNNFTAAQWQAMQAHYKHRCVYCGTRHKGHLTQDHLTPLSQGGAHTLMNIVPACRSCNSKKGTRTVLIAVQPCLL